MSGGNLFGIWGVLCLLLYLTPALFKDRHEGTGAVEGGVSVVGPIVLFLLYFPIWMFVDCLKNHPKDERTTWVLVQIFLPFLGAILYYLIARSPRVSDLKRKEKEPRLFNLQRGVEKETRQEVTADFAEPVQPDFAETGQLDEDVAIEQAPEIEEPATENAAIEQAPEPQIPVTENVVAQQSPETEEPTPVSDHKDCPMCGERVLAVAKKCKHCHEYLD